MKVLMFGWEFPPINSGGLGTACYGLTKALNQENVDITFVVPQGEQSNSSSHLNLLALNKIENDSTDKFMKIKKIASILKPYISSQDYKRIKRKGDYFSALYGNNLHEEVQRYAEITKKIAKQSDCDIIHAHDWLTFPAAIKAKEETNKPLVAHIHATEFDRTADNPDQIIYDIEKEGMMRADKIIAVSNFTKQKIIDNYEIPADKIAVVHNAVEHKSRIHNIHKKSHEKIVLFLGRLTVQKGADYFLYAAEKVLKINPDVLFVITGSGDMESQIIEKAAELNIANKVVFTGFLTGKDVDKMYNLADLYVMPSISEPFGITPLESLSNGTPVLISKQSGVSEVLRHVLKVDFWDTNQMANKILAVLQYPELYHNLKINGKKEAMRFNWQIPAQKCVDIYKDLIELHKIKED
ncbi:glycosyltransferase family 4 protein [Candidatus Woesearchaeota archaeon]|nr:glycosyltransferase family 4 protein [Candidatus Woesearchaeota archaeon]